MSVNDWYQVSALFGALAASSILLLAVIRASLYVVGKVRTRMRRLRLLKALPPPRTAFGKRQELKEEIAALEAAARADEAAEAKRLDEAAKRIEEEEKASPIGIMSGPGLGLGDWLTISGPPPTADGGRCTIQGGTGTQTGVGGAVTIVGGTGGKGSGHIELSAHGATYTFNSAAQPTFAHSISTETSLVGALNVLAKEVDRIKTYQVPDPGKISSRPRREPIYDTETLSPIPMFQNFTSFSPGTIAARPRKEPIWQRRVLAPGDYCTSFFTGPQQSQHDRPQDTNLVGSQSGLPYGHHFFLYTITVRLDDGTSDEDRRLIANYGVIRFDFTTTTLMTLPLGLVLDKGVQGHDMTVSGRPVELNAMESFSVRLELRTDGQRLSRNVGVLVALNGLRLKGITA